MVNIRINGTPYTVEDGMTIMEAAYEAGVDIPHLCYLKDVNEIGACRLCCVEVEGENKLIPACDNVVTEDMSIITNSPRVRQASRTNLELIMSRHDGTCTTCVRSGNCQLQNLCIDFSLDVDLYEKHYAPEKKLQWKRDFPLIRDNNKCVKCMRCVQICDKVQSMKIWDTLGTGSHTRVGVFDGRSIHHTDCTLCGQCITHCPVGALRARDDTDRVIEAISDPDIVTVFQIAPAIRTAWGEPFGLIPRHATVNRLCGCLKQMGADYVFDTSFTADLTIMEEANEFLVRLEKGDLEKYPMFTSCCPGWIRFIKKQFPELVPQLSTSKSPQQMFGAVMKSYFAEKIGVDPSKIFTVSIMPCVAKKGECDMDSMKSAMGANDVDVVLTTREVTRLLKKEHIPAARVADQPFDQLMAEYSGAGVIFGTTGGVMEAALRTAYFKFMGENPPADLFEEVNGFSPREKYPWVEKEFELKGQKLRIAVVNTLGHARAVCEAILREEVKYDFVEVMACPGGCSGGGGQPINTEDEERAFSRGIYLHELDKEMELRFSHENREVAKLYEDYLGHPLSERAEELLHVEHSLEFNY
ncbi:MAG: [FeFe] hydrogenase, group A [Lachnospiraceae bacterium]|nr:[FeFe] hydrogenase, group A [Lachnospiraceae bacterium]